ncbi:ParB-like nuclease domain protein [Microbacterium phage Fransoyer]|nr:ParB-like nuclease domain protein [Microbacterium phage RubyRalph]UUG69568.1 ParB-like nuclease domain protein [Microbacterium phage Fransoyer]
MSAPELVLKPVAQIIAFWRPGSGDWSWAEEMARLADDPRTHDVAARVRAEGFGFVDDISPVLLGSDGRVWDGHHRICLAIADGHEVLRCEIAGEDRTRAVVRALPRAVRRPQPVTRGLR